MYLSHTYRRCLAVISAALILVQSTTSRYSTVQLTQLTQEHIHSMKKRSLITSYDNFHITNITFQCDQLQDTADGVDSIALYHVIPEIPQLFARRESRLSSHEMKLIMRHEGINELLPYIIDEPDDKVNGLLQEELMEQEMANETPGDKSRPVSRLQATRVKREAIDSVNTAMNNAIINERCRSANTRSEDDPDYYHLCGICYAQTELADDHFPTRLSESYCQPSSTSCLGNGNGKCVTKTTTVHILKRKRNSNMCQLCLRDGTALAVDQWEPEKRVIRVGCECMISKLSDYRQRWFPTTTTTTTTNANPFPYLQSDLTG